MEEPQEKISVALCTFNGQRFLAEQLSSIRQQNRLPDELVVCDDGSTDRTVEILRRFATSVPFPVRVIQNEHNLGSTKNFEKAISLCSGELIALSDQDDIWAPDRLERSEQEFLRNPQTGMVFSDAEIIDDQGQPIGQRLWQSFQFTPERRFQVLAGKYELLVKYRFVTGATVMFRSRLRDRFLPIPAEWVHDEWMAAMLPAFSDLRPIDEPLIRYRSHSFQQLGVPSEAMPKWKVKNHWNTLAAGVKTNAYWDQLAVYKIFAETVCNRLSAMSLDERGKHILASYQSWLAFAAFRLSLPVGHLSRLVPIMKNLSCYAQHAMGLKSALKDFLRSRPR